MEQIKLLTVFLSLLAITSLHAQQNEIIYTEFAPPLLIQGDDAGGGNHQDKISIDLDENGEIDYEICFGFAKSEIYLYQMSYDDTKFREVGLVDSDTIIPYDGSGFDLPLFGSWCNNSIIGSNSQTGDYYDKVGFYKVIGGEKYYGWIHRYGHEDFSFPFLKWVAVDKVAFCAIPNYPLRWGQTSLTEGIDDNEATAFATLHPNPTTGLVTINGTNLKQAEVLNALGQRVATATGEGETLQVDISGLPAGVYFVNVTDKDGRKCVRKVVKE